MVPGLRSDVCLPGFPTDVRLRDCRTETDMYVVFVGLGGRHFTKPEKQFGEIKKFITFACSNAYWRLQHSSLAQLVRASDC